MLKLIVPIVVIAVLGISGFFLYQSFQTKPTSQPTSTSNTQTACPVLSDVGIDLPKIGKQVKWTGPSKSEFTVPLLKGGRKDKQVAGCLIKSEVISNEIASEIRNYFHLEEMSKKGWVEEVVADGPGMGIDSWSKAEKYFVVKTDSVNLEPPTQIVTLFYTP